MPTRRRDAMNAEVRAIKTPAEQALSLPIAARARQAAGQGRGRGVARGCVHASFDARGLPHRRVEEWKYTDLRALMRDSYPLAAPPDAAAKLRAKNAGKMLTGVDCRRLVFVDGAFAPELSDLTPEAGLAIGSMADALAKGDPLVAAHVGKTFRDRRCGGGAQHRPDGRRRRDPRCRRRRAQAADPSGLCRRAATSRARPSSAR